MDSEPETCLIGQFGTLGTGMHSQHLLPDSCSLSMTWLAPGAAACTRTALRGTGTTLTVD